MSAILKKCELCGKIFPSKTLFRKYCSKKCRLTAYEERANEMGQICWRCKNATGNCSWSRDLKPIKGWQATKSLKKDDMGQPYSSYRITYCPQFISD